MATFKPPTDDLVAWADKGERGIFAVLAPGPRGRNVWKMVDGSFREDQPSDWWNIAHLYHGGHIHEITAAEQADLEEAGYGNYITP